MTKFQPMGCYTPGFRSAALLKSPCRGFPSSPQFHLEFSGLIEELHRRVCYRLRNDPFHIWSSKELLVRSLWVHLSHMWSFLQNQYGYFSVWQVNMKYHIIIEKQSCISFILSMCTRFGCHISTVFLAFAPYSFFLSQNTMKYLLQVLVSFLIDEATEGMDCWN